MVVLVLEQLVVVLAPDDHAVVRKADLGRRLFLLALEQLMVVLVLEQLMIVLAPDDHAVVRKADLGRRLFPQAASYLI